MNKIIEMLKKIWSNKSLVLIISIVILVLLLLSKCDKIKDLKTQIMINNQNIEALHDTIKTVKNKAGKLQQEKLSLISSKKELENLNSSLYDELKQQKGQVLYISNLYATLKLDYNNLKVKNKTLLDSISQLISENGDTLDVIHWDLSQKYDDKNFRIIKGQSRFLIRNNSILSKGSVLEQFQMGFNISTGLREEKGMLRIWAKSDYPDLTFSDIEGSLIDPQKSDVLKKLIPQKRWVIGPQIGFGLSYSNGVFKPSPYIGFGLQYRMIGF